MVSVMSMKPGSAPATSRPTRHRNAGRTSAGSHPVPGQPVTLKAHGQPTVAAAAVTLPAGSGGAEGFRPHDRPSTALES